MSYEQATQIDQLIKNAQNILIMQADNPDGDSLGSALALEQIIGDMDKAPIMYCGVNMPSYLQYFSGWDRVEDRLPADFDLSIVVDCSSVSLFEVLQKDNNKHSLSTKPSIILDHHSGENSIEFATIVCNQDVVATGELIFQLSKQLSWPLNLQAKKMLLSSIMSDSLGLTSERTKADSIEIVAELVRGGVNIAELETERRELMRKSAEITAYKGRLLERIEYFYDNKIAIITIPWEEIEKYSNAYNPSMLVIDDMRLTEGTDIAIAFKVYKGGRVTAKIRCNYKVGIGVELAQHFGGGGHPYASGFKVILKDGQTFEDIKTECINLANDLLNARE
jgi:phosphoesterase RecJ-like protein